MQHGVGAPARCQFAPYGIELWRQRGGCPAQVLVEWDVGAIDAQIDAAEFQCTLSVHRRHELAAQVGFTAGVAGAEIELQAFRPSDDVAGHVLEWQWKTLPPRSRAERRHNDLPSARLVACRSDAQANGRGALWCKLVVQRAVVAHELRQRHPQRRRELNPCSLEVDADLLGAGALGVNAA